MSLKAFLLQEFTFFFLQFSNQEAIVNHTKQQNIYFFALTMLSARSNSFPFVSKLLL